MFVRNYLIENLFMDNVIINRISVFTKLVG